jgi:hypothetical protein
MSSCRLRFAVHVDDRFDVSGDVPACLKPGVQECRRIRRNLSPSDWKYRPNRRVTTYKLIHINPASQSMA